MLQIRCHVRLIIAAQRLEGLLKHFHMGFESQPGERQKPNQ